LSCRAVVGDTALTKRADTTVVRAFKWVQEIATVAQVCEGINNVANVFSNSTIEVDLVS